MSKRKPKNNAGTVAKTRASILKQITECQSLEAFNEALKEYNENDKQGKYSISGTIDLSLFNEDVEQEAIWRKNINEAIQVQQNKFSNPVLIKNAEPSVGSALEVPTQDNQDQASSSNQGLGQEQQAAQEKRKKELTRVTAELDKIAKKCEAMPKDSSYDEARGAVRRIHDAISDLAEKYVKDGDLTHFQVQTKALLKEDSQDMRIVNTHRGSMKNIFGNIGLFILGLGVGYLAVCAYRGSFFTFNTDSANRVEALETEVNAVRVIG